MTKDEPGQFDYFGQYMKTRLMMAAAVIFRRSGWKDWTYGHEKLMAIILWHFELNGQTVFKYSKLLKRHAYGRTQNYSLLKGIVEQRILIQQGNGRYEIPEQFHDTLKQAFEKISELDRIGDPYKT